MKLDATSPTPQPPTTVLRNKDEKDVGHYNKKVGLEFESRFESGNLRKVIQVTNSL